MRKLLWFSPLLVSAVVGSFLLASARPVVAQEASPAPGTSGGTACTVEPRSVDELLPLWFGPDGSPAATPMPSESVQSEADLPQGTPADEATVAAITATLHEVFACFDAAQYARAFALMTDNAVSQFGPDVSNPDEDSPEEVRALLEAQISGTPTTDEETMPAESRTVISDARDARILPDGRAGAIFEAEGDAVFAVFQQSGDHWLLDDIIDIEEQGTPAAGNS
jgi:hypothetical protein